LHIKVEGVKVRTFRASASESTGPPGLHPGGRGFKKFSVLISDGGRDAGRRPLGAVLGLTEILKVSALVYVLCRVTISRTLEKGLPRWSQESFGVGLVWWVGSHIIK